jgi:hypothetical protein
MQEEGKMTDNDLTSLPAPPTPGTQRASFAPTTVAPPERWAEARIPLDDAASLAS